MNPSIKDTLIDLVLYGQNLKVQTGIRLSLEFLESSNDLAAGIRDLHYLLESLEAEKKMGESREESLEDFQLRHAHEITEVTSAIGKLQAEMSIFKTQMKGQNLRLKQVERLIGQ